MSQRTSLSFRLGGSGPNLRTSGQVLMSLTQVWTQGPLFTFENYVDNGRYRALESAQLSVHLYVGITRVWEGAGHTC